MARPEQRESEVMIVEVHKDLLEILRAFDSVCRQHGVAYSLHAGTMLGAIREHGFIPWDDDADITMTRANFNKLMAAMKGSNADYCIKGRIKKQFYKVDDDQAWVDIFICDYISEKTILRKIKLCLLTVLDVMHRDRESMKLSNLKKYSKAKQLMFKLIYLTGQLFPKQWIADMYACVSESWFQGNKENLFRSNDQYVARKLIFPAAWMQNYEYVQFENTMLPLSREYHGLLIQSYGENYMTPIRDDRTMQVHDLVRSEQKIEL
jgi:phosphorylcholine metabolism protein LicD